MAERSIALRFAAARHAGSEVVPTFKGRGQVWGRMIERDRAAQVLVLAEILHKVRFKVLQVNIFVLLGE